MSATDLSAPDLSSTDPHTLLPTASNRQVRAALAELLRGRRLLAVAGVAVLVASVAVGLVVQPLLGHIVDLVLDHRGEDTGLGLVLGPVGVIALAAITSGALATVGLVLVARLGEGMLAQLRERFVERALDLPLDVLERAGSGDLTSRVTNDVTMVGEGVRDALPEFTRSMLTIVLTLAGLAVLDPRFLLAALVAVPVQATTVRWYLRAAGPVYARQRAAAGAQQQQLLETISGAATVRAFRIAAPRTALLADRSGRTVGLTLLGIRLQTRFFSRLNLAEYLGLSAVLAVGYLLVRDGAVTVGAATAAALYFHSLFTPINTALAQLDEAQSATASLARLVGVAMPPSDPAPASPVAPSSVSSSSVSPSPVSSSSVSSSSPRAGSIRVVGVRHAYRPGHDVVRGVDLEVPAGHRVALVGASGAGKTTLAKLIAGIHQPDAGRIELGGTPLDSLSATSVRRSIALITQEVHVFAGPLAEDLRLARPGASDSEIRAALDRVGALEWVDALPEGTATVVGDGGHRLSVAQAQHLALARLVLADPPIAILDEATAEAGSAGARALERAADRALTGRTALVVAHRLSQAAVADRIVVLEAGEVVEEGRHDELVAAGGRYSMLWQAWGSGVGSGVGAGSGAGLRKSGVEPLSGH